MNAQTTKDHEAVVIQLGTPVAEANAAAVASTMQAVVAIVEHTQQQLKLNEKLLLKARPFNEGSFEIPLELVIVGGAMLLGNQELINEILRIFKEFIEAKKLLKGKSPPPALADGSVVIDGDVKISNSVVNILVNSKLGTVVDKAATDVAGDETIKHVKVLTGEDRKLLTTIERDELVFFRVNTDSAPPVPTKDRHERTEVIIKSPVFEGTARWKFIWQGYTIQADIHDQKFMDEVRAGNEAFAAGYRLEVDLVVHEQYSESHATYELSGYSIVAVYKHSKRPERKERTLFDDETIAEN